MTTSLICGWGREGDHPGHRLEGFHAGRPPQGLRLVTEPEDGRVLSSFEAGTGTGEARPGHNDERMQQVLNTRSIVLHTEY